MLLAFVDQPQRHQRLTVFPVVASDEPQLSYLLLAEAIRSGSLMFFENGLGETPFLTFRNQSCIPVLMLDCEAVTDGKKNKGTSQSVLLGPGSVTTLPISCTDAGKWSCEEMEGSLAESFGDFPLQEGQVGLLAFLGRHLLGMDVLGTPGLYSQLHRRLLTGHLMTALAAGEKARMESSAEEAEIQALARALEGAERVAAPCLGSGEYSTLHGEVTGGELRHNGHLVHLSVFPNGVAA